MYKQILFLTLFISFSVLGQQQALKVKDTVPNFKLWLIDGNRLTNKDIKEKVVVFKFWFTSCIPCVRDIPTLNTLVQEFGKRDDIIFVAPALDRKPAIEKLLKTHPFNFRIAYSAMDVSLKFNTKQIYPSYFVINKKGKISYIDSGTKKSEFKDLRKSVIKALKM